MPQLQVKNEVRDAARNFLEKEFGGHHPLRDRIHELTEKAKWDLVPQTVKDVVYFECWVVVILFACGVISSLFSVGWLIREYKKEGKLSYNNKSVIWYSLVFVAGLACAFGYGGDVYQLVFNREAFFLSEVARLASLK